MNLLIGIVLTIIMVGICVYVVVKWVSRSVTNDMNNGQRNFKVRYEPTKHKYYLTNATRYGDVDVCRFGLFRVYYKSKIDADLIMQKLNDYQ